MDIFSHSFIHLKKTENNQTEAEDFFTYLQHDVNLGVCAHCSFQNIFELFYNQKQT